MLLKRVEEKSLCSKMHFHLKKKMKISKQGYLLPLLISINNSLHPNLHHILQSRYPQAHSPSSPGAMSCRIHQTGDADNPPVAEGGERRRRNPTRNLKMIPWQPWGGLRSGPDPTGRCLSPNLITAFWGWKKR